MHVLRGDSVLRTVLEGRMKGTRRRGGQITTMLAWMKSNDEEYELIKNRARNREEWRHWKPGLDFK